MEYLETISVEEHEQRRLLASLFYPHIEYPHIERSGRLPGLLAGR